MEIHGNNISNIQMSDSIYDVVQMTYLEMIGKLW